MANAICRGKVLSSRCDASATKLRATDAHVVLTQRARAAATPCSSVHLGADLVQQQSLVAGQAPYRAHAVHKVLRAIGLDPSRQSTPAAQAAAVVGWTPEGQSQGAVDLQGRRVTGLG